ncbi:MAG: DUF99 family protein [Gemmatimonadetes bacterium]|nr:DUF99 family protein [Gemmatimonadota bacterium]
MKRSFAHVLAVDDAPFARESRGDVAVVGAIFSAARLEGVVFDRVRRDGANATEVLTRLARGSGDRTHLQLVLLEGIALAGFNVVDIHGLNGRSGLAVLVVSRHKPDMAAVRRALLTRVRGGRRKWRLIGRAGPMEQVAGLWVQRAGLTLAEAGLVIERTAVNGRLPEPLRVAHLIARGLGRRALPLLALALALLPAPGCGAGENADRGSAVKAAPTASSYMMVADWPELPDSLRLGEVSGVDVDDHGHVFVFRRTGRSWDTTLVEPMAAAAVLMLDGTTGQLLARWGASTFILPGGLTVDHENNVWLTDVVRHQVFKFSHDGEPLLTLGEERVAAWDEWHFDGPADVAVAPDGTFYVADGYGNSRIARFAPDGTFLAEWGRRGKGRGEFDVVHDLAIGSLGRVYAADRENGRVQLFEPLGDFLYEWSAHARVYAVDVAHDGSVWVAVRDGAASQGLLRLGPGWMVSERIGFGQPEAEFDAVQDLAVGADGSVYVVETGRTGVRKLAAR